MQFYFFCYREENPEKHRKLERRMCTRETFRLPNQYSPASLKYIPVSPEYSPASPKYIPVLPEGSPASPGPELPEYSLASLECPTSALQPVTRVNPSSSSSRSMMHREFHAPTQPISLSTPGETQTSTSGLSPILTLGFWRETSQYPLKEKLNALNELVDSVRVDLLQTSMLVNYIENFMTKFHQKL